MGLLLEAQSELSAFFSQFGYLAPFTILVLCGFGLPLPEEVTMLGSGFLLYQGRVEMVPIIATCWVATLIGDSIPFWVGRVWGRRALQIRTVRQVLHPERLRNLERRFDRNGAWAVFVCRFLPGLRLPAWFTAGTLGMRYPRFIAIDAIGAAIMTPTFIFLGLASGEKIAELEETVENLHQILGFVVVALVSILVIHLTASRARGKNAALAAANRAGTPGEGAQGGGGGPAAAPSPEEAGGDAEGDSPGGDSPENWDGRRASIRARRVPWDPAARGLGRRRPALRGPLLGPPSRTPFSGPIWAPDDGPAASGRRICARIRPSEGPDLDHVVRSVTWVLAPPS